MAELRSYTPSWRERLVAGLLGDTRPTVAKRSFVEGLLGNGGGQMGLIDMIPGGQALAMQEAARAGDTQGALLAAMPVPGARQGRALMRGARKPLQISEKQLAKDAAISAKRSNQPPTQPANAKPAGAGSDQTRYTLVRNRAPRGDSARFQTLEKRFEENPGVAQQLFDLAKEGEDIGRRWYNTDNLRKRFISELGEEKGDAAFREYIELIGTTSPGAKVPSNIRSASYYYMKGPEWRAMNADKLIGKDKSVLPPKGSGYGHKMQVYQGQLVGKREKGLLGPEGDPNVAPKPRGFAQSLLGSETNIAADKHFMRLMGMMSDDPAFLHGSAEVSQDFVKQLRAKYGKGVDKFISEREKDGKKMINFNAKKAVREGPEDLYDTIKSTAAVWDDVPGKNEYAAFERMANKMARKLGMTGPQFQASLWMGAAKHTNVAEESLDTFEALFDKNLAAQAAERGLDPAQLFKNFVARKEALAIPGLLGAGAAGGGLLNSQDSPPELGM